MKNCYDVELSTFINKLEEISQSLRWADSAILNSSLVQKRFSHIIISSAYVLTAAATEEYMREMISGLCKEIKKANPNFSELRPSLVTIFAGSQINSLRDLKDYEKIWGKRREISNLFSSNETINEKNIDVPLDGKTIRPIHLETIWEIFGFSGQAFTMLNLSRFSYRYCRWKKRCSTRPRFHQKICAFKRRIGYRQENSKTKIIGVTFHIECRKIHSEQTLFKIGSLLQKSILSPTAPSKQ